MTQLMKMEFGKDVEGMKEQETATMLGIDNGRIGGGGRLSGLSKHSGHK